MTHEEKVQHFLADMTARGERESAAAPPLFKLLWRLGLAVRPPYFATFRQLMLFNGLFFGLGWGVGMWFFLWGPQGYPVVVALGASLTAGVMFGVAMAWFMRRKAQKLTLPAWEDYPAHRADDAGEGHDGFNC